MKSSAGGARRSRIRSAVLVSVVGCLMLAFSCTIGDELVVSPASRSVSVAPGRSTDVTFQVSIPDSKLKSVTLPIDVEVVGIDSIIPAPLSISGSPSVVSIAERGQPVDATVTISMPSDTPQGIYVAFIQPDALSRNVEDGAGIELRISTAPAPNVSISSPVDGSLVGEETVPIRATVSDSDGNFKDWEIFLDDKSIDSGSNEEPIESEAKDLEDGSEHTVEVRARDHDGNEGTAQSTFRVDLDEPVVTIEEPEEDDATGDVLHIAGSVEDDNLTGWQLLLDAEEGEDEEAAPSGGEEIASGGAEDTEVDLDFDTTSLSEGRHSITLTATDAAGHKGFQLRHFVVDRTTGTIAITKPAEGHLYVNDDPGTPASGTTVVGSLTATAEITGETLDTLEERDVTFTMGADQPRAADSLAEEGGKLIAKRFYSGVPNGPTTLTVKFTDKAEHQSTPSSVSFTGVAPPPASAP